MKIVAYIDDERVVFDSDETYDNGYLILIETKDKKEVYIETENKQEFYIAENSKIAGEKAREYWEELANDDPEEFAYLVGAKALIRWALGNYAGANSTQVQSLQAGSTQVQSLQEWLDLWLDIPEKNFASYDGLERTFRCKHPDWNEYTVAYRHN